MPTIFIELNSEEKKNTNSDNNKNLFFFFKEVIFNLSSKSIGVINFEKIKNPFPLITLKIGSELIEKPKTAL